MCAKRRSGTILPSQLGLQVALSGSFGVDRVAQSGHVPDRVEPPVMRVAGDSCDVALQRRNMVDSHYAAEIDVSVGTHTGEHVCLAFVVEGLDKPFRGASHIAE